MQWDGRDWERFVNTYLINTKQLFVHVMKLGRFELIQTYYFCHTLHKLLYTVRLSVTEEDTGHHLVEVVVRGPDQ